MFAPSNDIDMDLADDSDRVVEQYKRFLAEFPSPTDQPRVRPKVELDMKNIFKKKTTFSNSNSNLTNSGESVSVTSMTTQWRKEGRNKEEKIIISMFKKIW